ncbi:hypothetical protein PoB_004002500 [Plakobranchus ocellatus]|uniref:Uncharacterized protein n=1 Tax=Plakobranchus ocellatus TaxID=259542 RepID=A0AAV4B1Q1_9GAST|nr:hypothetical protein PoB_004002500 [Plakobranchus ocellatus]
MPPSRHVFAVCVASNLVSGIDTSIFSSLPMGRCRRTQHILWELWTKDIKKPDVKSSNEYVLNLWERLDDTLNIAREDLQKVDERSGCDE